MLQLMREPRFAKDERVVRCMRHVARSYCMPGFFQYIFTGNPSAFTGHLILWSALKHFGAEVPVTRAEIQKLIDSSRVFSPKRPFYRIIELRYFLDLGNFKHNLPKIVELFRQSVLALPTAGDVHEADIYAATHIAIYVTDFGRIRLTRLDDSCSARLSNFIVNSL